MLGESTPELQSKLKYIVPGEFAGKKTFKQADQLVNRAPSASPDELE